MKVDGVDIHVEGNGGETIVLIHGWPDTYRLWDKQVEFLKPRYRCVRFTLPGFDRAHERRARTLDEMAGFIRRVVEQAAPRQKVTLLLHDWGCVFGYHFCMKHPELVARVIGVDVGDLASREKVATLRDLLLIGGYQAFLALAWLVGGERGDRMTRYMARRAHCPSDLSDAGSHMDYPYYMTWFARRHSYRRERLAFEPACPMLFIYGRRKPFLLHAQPWIEWLLARKGNRAEAFDTGHWVMVQQPERFNDVVGEWLAATGAAA